MRKLWIMFLAALLTAVFAASAMAGVTISPNYVYDASFDVTLSQNEVSDITSYPFQYQKEEVTGEGDVFYSALPNPTGYSGGEILSVFTVSPESPDLVDSVFYQNVPSAIGEATSSLFLYFVIENTETSALTTVAVMPLAGKYNSEKKTFVLTELPSTVKAASFWDKSKVKRLILVKGTGTGSPTVGVTGVTLNKTRLLLAKGNSTVLTATVAPANATNKNVT